MITASHLPYNRNGFKFFTRDGGFEKKDITELLAKAAAEHATVDMPALAPGERYIDDAYVMACALASDPALVEQVCVWQFQQYLCPCRTRESFRQGWRHGVG